jgi:type VI secretion system protein ImpL
MKLPNMMSGLTWLKTKMSSKVIYAIVILLVIWLILPLIPINGVRPFASIGVRLALTGLLIAGVGVWFGVGFLQKYKLKSWQVVQTALSSIWQHCREFTSNGWRYGKEYYHDVHDKLHSERKRRRLKRLPWYLVLGQEQSGKSTFIQHSGLYFQRPEHIGEEAVNYINEFPDYDWWFTQQAILVDVMSNDAEQDVNRWKKFVKLLKRERKARPFNGVVLTMSLSDLLLLSNKERQELISRYSQYIRDIYSVFKAYVPIYLVFNKCDLVDGFMEFFENLSKEELAQVWGMTLPLEGCNDLQTVLAFFNREYTGLLQQLRKRVMWAFESEKTMRGRELINAFPQQMSLFRKPIEHFIAELFGATRYQRAIQCRGLYFTSSTQGQGDANDFLLQAMSKKFQLVPPQFNRPARIGESYFTRGLFFEVMLPEAGVLGNSERRKTIRHFLYRATLVGCPVAVIALGLGMHEGSVANKRNLEAVGHYISAYQAADDKIKKGDLSLTNTLPALLQLQQAKALYTTHRDFGLGFLWTSHHIKETLIDTEQRALHSIFLPRIAASLEHALKGNVSDQNIMYADLKGYLVFSSADYANKFALKAPMEYQWNQDFAAHPEMAGALSHFLNLALQEPIEKQPVDSILIGRIRSQLAEVNPAERAYGLLSLRANVGDDSAIYLASSAGNDFKRVFTETKANYRIPSLYTKRAYDNVFIKQYKAIAEEVAQDNRDIGLSTANDASSTEDSLETSLQTTYNQRYSHTWDDALGNITVKPFTSLNEAVNVLDVLVSNNSPLATLLNTVYDNTANVKHDDINVSDHFKNVNSYTQSAGWGTSWHATSKVLTQLRDYLVKLQQSPNQDQASFNVAKAVIEGKSANPMKQLTDLANQSPKPVKRWLMSVANNCWQIIIRGAHNQMNTAWNNTVVPSYNNGMRGRFPLVSKAYSSVTMQSFNQVLGYGGALDNYFTHYIKPFVNTESEQWKPYSEHGLTIEIPQSHIDAFKRAKVIRQEYFPAGAKKASLNINITPLTLDKRATSIEFVMGPDSIKYSHGPQHESSVTWPLPFNSQDSRIVITTFNADQYAHSASGAWSLFRMFHYGVFKSTGEDGSYQFDINFRGHTASFAVTGSSDIDVFTLKHLIGFSLPEVIAPTPTKTTKPIKKEARK